MTAKLNFVQQQGLKDASPKSCAYQDPALMWQPRAIGVLVLIGVALQVWPYFLGLGALLWWNVVFPKLNPFDALVQSLRGQTEGAAPAWPGPESAALRCANAGWNRHARDCVVSVRRLAHTRVGR